MLKTLNLPLSPIEMVLEKKKKKEEKKKKKKKKWCLIFQNKKNTYIY
jgi:hypothetical protein